MTTDNLVVLGADNLVTVVFRDPRSAEVAYLNLIKEGYNKEDINLIMSDETRDKYFSNNKIVSQEDIGNKSLEGMGIGAAAGGAIGAIASAIAALGTSLVLPGLNLIVSGALAAGLAGAGAGATAGGLMGGLIGWGIPDEKAKILADEIEKGGVVISVETEDENDRDSLIQRLSMTDINKIS
ncbi:hypothetical protein [Candidatus Paracaedibacter symbiosus]|uniref:hypothetical protein n=1 Tax=Candidatus Paracaedibacter symbiosus TaxID=244582 RepID=UPI000509FA1A|nr:hypothetical protein [Candidatus Paracaedibacter symbiosus]